VPDHVLELESWEELIVKVQHVCLQSNRVVIQWVKYNLMELDDSQSMHTVEICKQKCPLKVCSS
jgi:hypothetical protein